MAETTFTCPLCGYRFEASWHGGCRACPLNKGCQMVCCPACGYTGIDPHRSVLARWWMLLNRKAIK